MDDLVIQYCVLFLFPSKPFQETHTAVITAQTPQALCIKTHGFNQSAFDAPFEHFIQRIAVAQAFRREFR